MPYQSFKQDDKNINLPLKIHQNALLYHLMYLQIYPLLKEHLNQNIIFKFLLRRNHLKEFNECKNLT